MINLKSILWLLPLSLLVSPLLYGENLPDKWYKGTIQATAIELQQVGDSLHIQVLYDLDKIKVSSNHSIELIPVLIAANHQLELPEISVKGHSNFQNLKRKLALMNTQERDFYQSEALLCCERIWNNRRKTNSIFLGHSIRIVDERCTFGYKKGSNGLLQTGQVIIDVSAFRYRHFGATACSISHRPAYQLCPPPS